MLKEPHFFENFNYFNPHHNKNSIPSIYQFLFNFYFEINDASG